MITPAELDSQLHPLENEFWKVIESKEAALILNWVIHSLDFAENLVEISLSGRNDIDYTGYEMDDLREALIAVKSAKKRLTSSLAVRREKQ